MTPHYSTTPRRRAIAPALCCAALLFAIAAPIRAGAQTSIEDFAGAYLGANAQGFFGPLAKVLTADLNSGFEAPVPPSSGFSLRFGVAGGNSLITSQEKTFTATTEPGFRPAMTVQAPTILGSATPVQVSGQGGTGYTFPAGVAVKELGLAVPQLTIGSILGTELTARGVAVPFGGSFGTLSVYGGGLQHNISQYLPSLPVALGIGGMYNQAKLGDILDIKAELVDVTASRRVGWLDFYGGAAWEQSTVHFQYSSQSAATGQVDIDLDGTKGMRETLGLRLSLPVVALSADVNFGTQTVFGAGLSFGTRY